eukprot:scaffold37556_cov67-Phaeocystis_antarctica.AAC.1
MVPSRSMSTAEMRSITPLRCGAAPCPSSAPAMLSTVGASAAGFAGSENDSCAACSRMKDEVRFPDGVRRILNELVHAATEDSVGLQVLGEPALTLCGSRCSSLPLWSAARSIRTRRCRTPSCSATACSHSRTACSAFGLRPCWMSSSCSSAALRLAMLAVIALRASSRWSSKASKGELLCLRRRAVPPSCCA